MRWKQSKQLILGVKDNILGCYLASGNGLKATRDPSGSDLGKYEINVLTTSITCTFSALLLKLFQSMLYCETSLNVQPKVKTTSLIRHETGFLVLLSISTW